MSKKDYIAIADALKPLVQNAQRTLENLSVSSGTEFDHANATVSAFEEAAEAIANVFAADSPAFKRDRWFSYLRGECGPNGGTVKSSKSK